MLPINQFRKRCRPSIAGVLVVGVTEYFFRRTVVVIVWSSCLTVYTHTHTHTHTIHFLAGIKSARFPPPSTPTNCDNIEVVPFVSIGSTTQRTTVHRFVYLVVGIRTQATVRSRLSL